MCAKDHAWRCEYIILLDPKSNSERLASFSCLQGRNGELYGAKRLSQVTQLVSSGSNIDIYILNSQYPKIKD